MPFFTKRKHTPQGLFTGRPQRLLFLGIHGKLEIPAFVRSGDSLDQLYIFLYLYAVSSLLGSSTPQRIGSPLL
jgi:hypothetical protein